MNSEDHLFSLIARCSRFLQAECLYLAERVPDWLLSNAGVLPKTQLLALTLAAVVYSSQS